MALGELRSKVRYIIHKYLTTELTNEEFKDNIQKIIGDFKGKLPEKLLCQNI